MAAASALAVGAIVAAPAAVADDEIDLGPTLIKTDAEPTGYAVTFRYQAPEGVNQVHVYGDWTYSVPENVTCDGCGDGRLPYDWQPGDVANTQWRTIPMVKGDDDVWEVTVPLPAGSFRYAFVHNCASVVATGCTLYPDPENMWEIQPQYPGAPGAVRSTIWVPEHPDFPTYDTDYQRPLPSEEMGVLESVRYPSPLSTNPVGVHDMLVYTPKGYDPNRAEPYPTLYLSHGSGDHSTAWFMQGVAHYIVQNAINDGAAPEMVVVATDFNGLPGGEPGYIPELVNNVIPYIEEHYNVSTEAIDRAFGGFSAGGGRAATILYNQPDLFGWHAVWSAAPPMPNAEQLQRIKDDVQGAIMIGTGLQDRLANVRAGTFPAPPVNQSVLAWVAGLKAAGVDIVDHHVPGGHTWHAWRPLLNFYIRSVAFHPSVDTAEIPITAEVTDPPGALTLTVADFGGAVELGDEAKTGNAVTFIGALPDVTVTDTRNAAQAGDGGWQATGRSSAFQNGNTYFGGEHLGWTPTLVQPKAGVAPGGPVPSFLEGGSGLTNAATLASVVGTDRRGETVLSAALELTLPATAPTGTYNGTITVSLFPVD